MNGPEWNDLQGRAGRDRLKTAGLDPVRRWILIAAGTLFLAIGVIALLIPVVPTTPFLMAAAACYIRSSKHFYTWLINHRWLGPPVRAYREEKGMTLWNKILTVATFWIANLITALFIVRVLWLKFLLLAFASFMTWHVARLKTLR